VGIAALTMHGGIDQHERNEIMKSFAEGKVKMLITTDLNARGVDIPNVDFVVNYDLPEEAEVYVHRVGRTGRGVAKGTAYSFCAPEEKPLLKAVEDYVGNKISEILVDKETYLETLVFTEDTKEDNWKALLKEAEKEESQKGKKKKK